jgi:2-C-methyl-D-erythritol 4-phosphate cytidylyltransferase/2-C-methyl-D-erythritol 2,4-cyclodiphosphate synthase
MGASGPTGEDRAEEDLRGFDVVVVAAGSSRRMGGIDKLGVPLLGRPLLAWTLGAFRAVPSVRRLVVVAGPGRVADLAAEPWLQSQDARVVTGGARRQESVANGVRACDSDVVLVHDGARPLVTAAVIEAVARGAAAHGAAIPVQPVAETLKRVAGDRVVETVDRSALVAAQTPQGARRELLERAWSRYPPDGAREFTDEAALLEATGVPVVAVAGDPDNLKVTLPGDVPRAEAALLARSGPMRVGYGADEHPFGPAAGLALGGIEIPGAPRLRGHSDGDAVLHAVCDALLGAAGQGDLGRLFPAGDVATVGIASTRLLEAVVARLAEAGWRPSGVDVTIRAARPRLGRARLEAMRDAMAMALGLVRGSVEVKASSGNLVGYEGAGRGIAATAVATVVRR